MNHPDPLLNAYLTEQRQAFQWAVQRLNREIARGGLGGESLPPPAQALLTYLHALEWLRWHVHPAHREAVATASRNPRFLHVGRLLATSGSPRELARRHLEEGLQHPPETPWGEEARALAAAHGHDLPRALEQILGIHAAHNPYAGTRAGATRRLQRQQKAQWAAFLGPDDRERLALLDSLPDPEPGQHPRFAKVGIIPRWACPQSCRHCQFIHRPPMATPATGEFAPLLAEVERITASLLFTGGDLMPRLPLFHQAIATTPGITTHALVLNAATLTTPEAAESLLAGLETALERRPPTAPRAGVVLQVSCDEFHQELLANHRGEIRERIPVANVAHLMMAAPRHPRISLALLHKQNRHNFSDDLFRRGVLARLTAALAERGERLQLLSATPAPRPKADPVDPTRLAPVFREVVLALASAPHHPMVLHSSTVDGLGRAALLDPSATVGERPYLQQVLERGATGGERWDTDPMFWTSGPVTLFQCPLYPLGDWRRDGFATIHARHRKDPLRRALEGMDPRLPPLYDHLSGGGLAPLLARSTGPHHLFHLLVEEAPVRLALTRALLSR